MKKLLSVLLFLPITAILIFNSAASANGKTSFKDDVFSCLLVGFDDASENTDVISVLSYSIKEKSLSLVQIPRDSYCVFNGKAGKINSIYPKLRATGKKRSESLELLLNITEEYFGITLDGYAAFSLSVFASLVDKIGGVYINVPNDFDIKPFKGKLKHGENLIDGETAKLFVRHRSSYPGGDISRLDAQKIFWRGLFKTFFEKADLALLLSLLTMKDDGVTADVPTFEISKLLMMHAAEIRDADINILTMPGEPLNVGGVSYYIVNKTASSDLVRKFLFAPNSVFDKNSKLTNKNNTEIDDLYNRITDK